MVTFSAVTSFSSTTPLFYSSLFFPTRDIYGTFNADTLYGTDRGEKIYAGSGNDVVWAGGGDDTVYGDVGQDFISGGLGNDVIFGGSERDNLLGGQGSDYIYGESGDDVIWGEGGGDRLVGGTGADTFRYDAGDTTLYVATGRPNTDTIYDFSRAEGDKINMPIAGTWNNFVSFSTAPTTMESALDGANAAWANRGKVYAYNENAQADIAFLLIDSNADGYFDSGITILGLARANFMPDCII